MSYPIIGSDYMLDVYKIQKGDSLNSIAERFNVTVDKICEINKIYYPNKLRVGMDIIIPQDKESYFNTYVIEKGDNLYAIARKYNINPELLAAMNGLNNDDYIYPNQELLIPKSGYSYYLTAEGDTIDTVANMFKVSKDKVIKENSTLYLLPDQLIVNKK